MIRQVWEKHVSRGSPHWAPPPKFFETAYMHAHNMRNDNQILHGCEENFSQGRPRMLMHDLCVVANLVKLRLKTNLNLI